MPKISEAPRTISEFPGFFDVPCKELDAFEDRCEHQERGKWYKAIDSRTGAIWHVMNPWVTEREKRGYRVRKQVLTYAEARAEGARPSASNPGGFMGSSQNSTDEDY